MMIKNIYTSETIFIGEIWDFERGDFRFVRRNKHLSMVELIKFDLV